MYDEDLRVRYVKFEVMMEPPGGDVWNAIEHRELELERVEGAIDFGVILTKVKFKALGIDELSMSEGMGKKELRPISQEGNGGSTGDYE